MLMKTNIHLTNLCFTHHPTPLVMAVTHHVPTRSLPWEFSIFAYEDLGYTLLIHIEIFYTSMATPPCPSAPAPPPHTHTHNLPLTWRVSHLRQSWLKWNPLWTPIGQDSCCTWHYSTCCPLWIRQPEYTHCCWRHTASWVQPRWRSSKEPGNQ